MRRSSSSPSIQLFPFLDVLVCAMGALILLMQVTIRKMHQTAAARAAVEEEPESIVIPAPVPRKPTGPELSPAHVAPDLAAQEAEKQAREQGREARRLANAAARQRQAEREAAWERELS